MDRIDSPLCDTPTVTMNSFTRASAPRASIAAMAPSLAASSCGPGAADELIPEDATDASSWAFVDTVATLAEAKLMTNETFGFDFCSIAVSPAGTLYLQTGAELWVGTPVS
jgi:hypothetical protein